MTSSDPVVSLQMTIVSDAIRHVNRSTRFVPYDDLRYDLTRSQFNMTSHHHHVFNLSYFTHINNTSHTMEYILSKVLPQACQGRTTGIVIRELLEKLMNKKIKHPTHKSTKIPCPDRLKVMVKVQELMKVSLLGNYLHVTPDTRPVGKVRNDITLMCNNDEWILNTLTHCEQLFSYCLRDYLVYAIQEDPALHRFMKTYMNFDEFKSITCKYMDEVRRYLKIYMQFPSTSISNALAVPLTESQQYHRDLDLIFRDSKSENLRAKYHRPNDPFVEFLLERKNKYQPKLSLLTQVHIDALKQIITRTTKETFLATLIVLLPSFGIEDQHVLDAIRMLLRLYEWSSVSILRLRYFIEGQEETRDKLTKRVKKPFVPAMYHLHEYLYTIIQTGCMMWYEHYKVNVMASLPVHYIVNQIDAAQSSLGLTGSSNALDSQFYLLYCDVCDEVYSLLREVDTTDSSHIKDQKDEEANLNLMCGYRDAVVDYNTGLMYCCNWNDEKTSVCADGTVRKCGDQPLVRKCLLGDAVRDGASNRTIMLCPQDSCCVPMVLHTDCAYTERGVCCSDCTKALEQNPTCYDRLLQDYNDMMTKPVECDACFNVIDSKKKMYMYPHGLVLCRKHHSSRIARTVKETTASHKPDAIQCNECYGDSIASGTYQLCEKHYNRLRLNGCKQCARETEFKSNIMLCEEHRENTLVVSTISELNRLIVLCLLHTSLKSLQMEKKERFSLNKDKFNRQRMHARTSLNNKQRR